MSAQQEYDALVAQLRTSATYEGKRVLEWDAYKLDRQILDKADPNIVLGTDSQVWVSIQVETPTKDGSGTGGILIDKHWPAADVADPRADGADPHMVPAAVVVAVAPLVADEPAPAPAEQPRVGGKFAKAQPASDET